MSLRFIQSYLLIQSSLGGELCLQPAVYEALRTAGFVAGLDCPVEATDKLKPNGCTVVCKTDRDLISEGKVTCVDGILQVEKPTCKAPAPVCTRGVAASSGGCVCIPDGSNKTITQQVCTEKELCSVGAISQADLCSSGCTNKSIRSRIMDLNRCEGKQCASTGLITDVRDPKEQICYGDNGFIKAGETCFARCAYGYKKKDNVAENGKFTCDSNGRSRGKIECVRDPTVKPLPREPPPSPNSNANGYPSLFTGVSVCLAASFGVALIL